MVKQDNKKITKHVTTLVVFNKKVCNKQIIKRWPIVVARPAGRGNQDIAVKYLIALLFFLKDDHFLLHKESNYLLIQDPINICFSCEPLVVMAYYAKAL